MKKIILITIILFTISTGTILVLKEEEPTDIEQLKRNNAYLNVDYSKYSCPPVLTKQECHKRIDMCLINGFDVEKYLLQVYNRLK